MIIDDSEFREITWGIKDIQQSVDIRQKFNKEFSEVFPLLKPGKCELKEANRLSRYIIYLYDKNSPLRKHIKNIDERRNYAAKLAGYDVQNVSKEKKKAAVDGQDLRVCLSIMSFIKFIDNKRYAQLVILENEFWEYHKQLMRPMSDNMGSSEIKTRRDLRTELKSIQVDIETLEYDVFGGDRETAAIVKEVRKMKTTPEHMAI